jgi:hypothetical protein
MPSEAFQKLLERVVSDDAFFARLESDREATLAEYDLTEDERQALRSGEAAKLSAVGLDERVSKLVRVCWV